MKRYTADTNALLSYLADVLPESADGAFSQAERGTARIEAPPIVFGELFHRLRRGTTVNAVEIDIEPRAAWHALVLSGPISLAAFDHETVQKLLEMVDSFSLHDALVVASHLGSPTDAIITRDPDIGAVRSVKTVWR